MTKFIFKLYLNAFIPKYVLPIRLLKHLFLYSYGITLRPKVSYEH